MGNFLQSLIELKCKTLWTSDRMSKKTKKSKWTARGLSDILSQLGCRNWKVCEILIDIHVHVIVL